MLPPPTTRLATSTTSSTVNPVEEVSYVVATAIMMMFPRTGTIILVAASISAFDFAAEAFAPAALPKKGARPKCLVFGQNPSGLQVSQSINSATRQPRQPPMVLSPMVLSMQGESNDDDAAQSSTTSSNAVSTPLDRPVLAAVDIAALIGFAAVGKASHSADGSLDIGAVLFTAFPFVTSWLLTSPLTGVYTEDTRDGNVVLEAFLKTSKGWVLSVPIGIALRGVIKGYVPPVSFVIVTLIATLVILGGSRVLFAIAEDFFVELVN